MLRVRLLSRGSSCSPWGLGLGDFCLANKTEENPLGDRLWRKAGSIAGTTSGRFLIVLYGVQGEVSTCQGTCEVWLVFSGLGVLNPRGPGGILGSQENQIP